MGEEWGKRTLVILSHVLRQSKKSEMYRKMIKNITYEELKIWELNKFPFQLIDVREQSEHEVFNIGGLLIPLSDILKEKEKLNIQKPIVFYCKRGIRSQIAIQKLLKFFPKGDFYNLQSGIGTNP